MYKCNPRSLTRAERAKVEDIRDMLNGNINRMCVSDDLAELYDRAIYALIDINEIMDIVTDRFCKSDKGDK